MTMAIQAILELIITCARHFEEDAKSEIISILEEMDDEQPDVTITSFSGILVVKTSLPHTRIIERIREKVQDEPWAIRYILRLIPMLDVVSCDLDSIVKSAAHQAHKMKRDETYRITIEKRDTGIRSSDIISRVAGTIENKVSLEEYDWVVLIETVGSICGVSIIREDEILSVERLKRGSLE